MNTTIIKKKIKRSGPNGNDDNTRRIHVGVLVRDVDIKFNISFRCIYINEIIINNKNLL